MNLDHAVRVQSSLQGTRHSLICGGTGPAHRRQSVTLAVWSLSPTQLIPARHQAKPFSSVVFCAFPHRCGSLYVNPDETIRSPRSQCDFQQGLWEKGVLIAVLCLIISEIKRYLQDREAVQIVAIKNTAVQVLW